MSLEQRFLHQYRKSVASRIAKAVNSLLDQAREKYELMVNASDTGEKQKLYSEFRSLLEQAIKQGGLVLGGGGQIGEEPEAESVPTRYKTLK